MKMKLTIIFFLLTLIACGQDDSTFTKIVTFEKGFRVGTSEEIQLTPFLGSTSDMVLWDDIPDKPLVFPPDLTVTDARYKAIDWQPEGIFLDDYLDQLGYLPIPRKTTEEIEAKILPDDKAGIVFDKTLEVYKIWKKTGWKIISIVN